MYQKNFNTDDEWFDLKKKAEDLDYELTCSYDSDSKLPYEITIWHGENCWRSYQGEKWYPYDEVTGYLDAIYDI